MHISPISPFSAKKFLGDLYLDARYSRTVYVTRSRKMGPFPQKSDCELDLSADSAKSVVHARENRLTLARSVPKLQPFEYHTRAYLGFEISAFISVLSNSLRILPEVDTRVQCLPVITP